MTYSMHLPLVCHFAHVSKLVFMKRLFLTARLLHEKQNTLYYCSKNPDCLEITYTKNLPEALYQLMTNFKLQMLFILKITKRRSLREKSEDIRRKRNILGKIC